MPREKEAYRDIIERIKERFPNKEMLSITDVINFTGLCRNKVKKMFPFRKDNYIAVAALARSMCAD